MKILQIINNLGSGGAEKLLEDLIPLMNQVDDIEIDILLLTDKNNVFYDSLKNKRIQVEVIKYRSIYDPRNILEITKYIKKGRYDIVHSHVFPTQYWVALSRLILRNNQVKFITTEHSTHNKRREKSFFKPIEKFIYSNYDTIISITEKSRDNLINWIDPRYKKTGKHIVIENGVDLEKIKGALPYKKTELIEGIDENTKIVCMVGRFSEAKDQQTLIKAVNMLSNDIHLVLVGEGTLIHKNKDLVKHLGISNRVHFLGFRHDIPRILKTVDVVVLSSYWEGLSLAALEGLASGRPFIASKVNGLEELVSGYGLIFEQGDVDGLASSIYKLFKSDDTYYEVALKCSQRSEQYSIQNTVKRSLEVYQSS